MDAWQPLDTAPVPSATEVNPRTYRFDCMLQDKFGTVFEGDAHYVRFSNSKDSGWVLRWYRLHNKLCKSHPLYWMPLPAPRTE